MMVISRMETEEWEKCQVWKKLQETAYRAKIIKWHNMNDYSMKTVSEVLLQELHLLC